MLPGYDSPMTTLTDFTVDQLQEQARHVRPGRVLLTIIAAVGTAIGWAVGRFFLSIGWLAGRTWLILAFFTEAVIYGFRGGAGLPQKASPEEKP